MNTTYLNDGGNKANHAYGGLVLGSSQF